MKVQQTCAIFFQAHQWSPVISARFERLWREVSGFYDCYLLLQDDDGHIRKAWQQDLERIGAGEALRLFNPHQLPEQLGYEYFSSSRKVSTRSLVPGSSCFPLLYWARSEKYANYWLVELDVEYGGSWPLFFSTFEANTADLLVSHLRRYKWYSKIKNWHWWRSLSAPSGIQPVSASELRKAFFPVYRISAAALALLDKSLQQGWIGHYEVLLPTLLHLNKMVVLDLNEVATSYVGDYQNPCKNSKKLSTMRWSPDISLAEFSARNSVPLLFHPVKQNWHFDGIKTIQG